MSLQKKGSINAIEAFERFKISRLSAVIYDLREIGFRIITEHKTTSKTKYGYRRAYVEYSFAKPSDRKHNDSKFSVNFNPADKTTITKTVPTV